MEKSTITIRAARPEDAAALLVIYAPYVEKTAITFEYEVPSVEEFTQRITSTLARYPYLVAEADGQILGYAYVGTFSKCGYKFHRWYDMIWMEKHIGEHLENQPPIRLFPDVQKELGF